MNDFCLTRPDLGEFPAYYGVYIEQAATRPLADALQHQADEVRAVLGGLTPEQAAFRYAEGKWSIAELLGHLIDCERIFATRALCIARGEQQAMPGFDENTYVERAGFDQRSLISLLDEFTAVRASTLALLGSFTDRDLQQRGTANGGTFTPRAIAWILVGHVVHHMRILRERYGVA